LGVLGLELRWRKFLGGVGGVMLTAKKTLNKKIFCMNPDRPGSWSARGENDR